MVIYRKYEAICGGCGKKGFCIESGPSERESRRHWVGFLNMMPVQDSTPRSVVENHSFVPQCKCGCENILMGNELCYQDEHGIIQKGVHASINGMQRLISRYEHLIMHLWYEARFSNSMMALGKAIARVF